ncbi:MAG: hypothetical protein GF404_11225 [candidate division Zixibacteria bacterium]|nr:hypothetical protein [candidate division Zixibacteria bacterium]
MYICRKSNLIIWLSLVLVMLLGVTGSADEDVVVSALSDEIERNMENLKLEDEARPYFIRYLVNLENNCHIKAEYGSIVKCDRTDANQMFIDLRVGDYDFDNSNFVHTIWQTGMETVNLPVELDYHALRHAAWLGTDNAYKTAIENLAMKSATLQNRMQEDTLADLSRAKKVRHFDEFAKPQADTSKFKEILADLSSVFRDYPQFKHSSVELNTKTENRYIINSEGTQIRKGRHIHYIFIEARGLDDNGLPVYNYDRIIFEDIEELPSVGELRNWIKSFADETAILVETEPLEDYIGPVIFHSNGANQFLVKMFLDNISNPRRPLTSNEGMKDYLHDPKLARKIGFRVVPDFISIYDDPTITEYKGLKLAGDYLYDDDGVKAEKVQLVKNGRLRNYYMSRTPTKKITESNGHGRLIQGGWGAVEVVGKPGNVIIESEETFSFEELKQQMLELCRAMDIEYGLIVEQMNFSGRPDTDGRMRFARRGQDNELPRVLKAYKISVKDGSLTPVRGMDYANLSVRTLKDILAVGDDYNVYHSMFDGAFTNTASVVLPSILVEEMELTRMSATSRKPPIVDNPLSRD